MPTLTSRFLVDLRIGPRTLATTLALVTTVGCCCQGLALPLLLMDDHAPIGYMINTAHVERLNDTIRCQQQARLGRRTRNGSRLTRLLQFSLWLWRDLYHWTRIHASLGQTPAMALELTQSVWSVWDYIRHPVPVSDYQLQEWAEQRNSIAKSAIEIYKRE